MFSKVISREKISLSHGQEHYMQYSSPVFDGESGPCGTQTQDTNSKNSTRISVQSHVTSVNDSRRPACYINIRVVFC